MEPTTKAISRMDTCMAEECLSGTKPAEDTKVTTILVRKKASENTTTTIPSGTRVCGKTANSMAKGQFIKMDIRSFQVDGNMDFNNKWAGSDEFPRTDLNLIIMMLCIISLNHLFFPLNNINISHFNFITNSNTFTSLLYCSKDET
jgi:hypothetical protein